MNSKDEKKHIWQKRWVRTVILVAIITAIWIWALWYNSAENITGADIWKSFSAAGLTTFALIFMEAK